MVEQDHVTRRTAIKSGAAALATVSGIGLVGSASALDGSTVRIEGDGSYQFYIRGNYDTYETEDFEDTIYIDDGNSIWVSGSVDETASYWFFGGDDDQDVIHLDQTITTVEIDPMYPNAIDGGVDISVDGDSLS